MNKKKQFLNGIVLIGCILFFIILCDGSDAQRRERGNVPKVLVRSEQMETMIFLQEEAGEENGRETDNTSGEESILEIPAAADMEGARVYEYWSDMRADTDIPFVTEETFEIIKAAYDEVDFFGEFEKGDMACYDFYREKFFQLLNNEVTFTDRETEEEYYIKDYGYIESISDWNLIYDANELSYLFFDMNGDGAQELVITNRCDFIYIFRYDAESDRFYLWYEPLGSTWYGLNGSGKVRWMCLNVPGGYSFYQLDEQGEEECQTFFFFYPISENVSVCMVMLPEYAGKEAIPTAAMRQQGCYARKEGNWYFRVTEEQFDELMEPYLDAEKQSEEKKEEVTYTYTELFEDLMEPPAKVEEPGADKSALKHYRKFLLGKESAAAGDKTIDMDFILTRDAEREEHIPVTYTFYDLDKDGVAELHIRTGMHYYMIKYDGAVMRVWKILDGDYILLDNGGFFKTSIIDFDRFGFVAECYVYVVLDFNGNLCQEIAFGRDRDLDGIYKEDSYYYQGERVTGEQWEELTRSYFEQSSDTIEWMMVYAKNG